MAAGEVKNDLLLRAARGEHVDKVPVWIMRQAGRYLPEFQEVRKTHDFFEICDTPALTCEITLQPIRRFEMDAAIIFSDILIIPRALGMEVNMVPGKGPVFSEPLAHPSDVDKIPMKADVMCKLESLFDGIRLTRKELAGKVPLYGFSGAPFTLMSYMIEGQGSKTLCKAKSWLYKWPDTSHILLQRLTNVCTQYLIQQAKAGAQMLQVFESHAEYLNISLFKEYSLPYIKQIVSGVKRELGDDAPPMVIFAKGGHYALELLGSSGYDVVGIDWTVEPSEARRRVGTHVTLQGNLDPCALYLPDDKLDEACKELVEKFGTQKWICNLGHGIYPDMDPGKVKIFVDAIHKYSAEKAKSETF